MGSTVAQSLHEIGPRSPAPHRDLAISRFPPVWNIGQFLARARAEAPGDPECLCVYVCW